MYFSTDKIIESWISKSPKCMKKVLKKNSGIRLKLVLIIKKVLSKIVLVGMFSDKYYRIF